MTWWFGWSLWAWCDFEKEWEKGPRRWKEATWFSCGAGWLEEVYFGGNLVWGKGQTYEPCFKKSCKQTQQQHKVCVCEKTLDEGSIQLFHPLQEWKNVGTGGQSYVWGVRCKSWFGLWVFATLRALKVVLHCIVEIEVVNKCFSKE